MRVLVVRCSHGCSALGTPDVNIVVVSLVGNPKTCFVHLA